MRRTSIRAAGGLLAAGVPGVLVLVAPPVLAAASPVIDDVRVPRINEFDVYS